MSQHSTSDFRCTLEIDPKLTQIANTKIPHNVNTFRPPRNPIPHPLLRHSRLDIPTFSPQGQEEFCFKPHFHNAIAYCHKNFYKTQEDPPKFSPCVFETSEEDGDVASISLEIDLEMFFRDPIYKPAEIKSRSGTLELSISPGHPILPPTYMTILYPDNYSFRHPWFYGPIPPYKDATADAEFTKTATVGDFLMSIPRTINLMMEFLYQSSDDAVREKAMLIKYFETSLRVGRCREGYEGLFLFVRERLKTAISFEAIMRSTSDKKSS
ncbi:hypothetical protein TWF751_001734 [Orbilia oligospora]|nr:hypothetical protein TWF751_001734 [Orbilia oligospora]